MSINKNSLQARIKNISDEKKISANIILQNYFFDAFLKRLAKSKYRNNFVFKGGLLLSTALGVNLRTTMDIDFLIRNLALTRENIQRIFEEILELKINDNITFDFTNIKVIKQFDEYGGYTVSILGHLENIKVSFGIDIATGDPLTPDSIIFNYKCLLDDEVLNLPSYNFETIIAEKIQTVLKRGSNNSRCKDFYDLFIILKLRWNIVDMDILRRAYINTSKYRNTFLSKKEALSIVNDISNNAKMFARWKTYAKKNEFARDIEFTETIDAIKSIIDVIY